MKRLLLHFAWFAALLAVGGFLVAASGLVPIKASSGHWPITKWFLKFGMHRSFSTHSIGVKAPSNLDAPHLILKGATYYDFGCRSCHGSPGARAPRIAQSMTPKAPELAALVREWEPEELFALVKHGVKFTGMPAWPAQQRDDEVWAMVAFLQKLPGLSAEEYRQLVQGEPAPTAPIQELDPTASAAQTPAAVNQTCARCHGSDGQGRDSPAFPILAGQSREYLEQAILAYADGRRHSGIMAPLASGLSDDAARELAAFYSGLPRKASTAPSPSQEELELLDLGRKLATEGSAADRIPACIECHDPRGHRRKPAYPSLAGQPATYLQLQLELFQQGKRGGAEHAHLMQDIAPRLSPKQVRAVSLFFAARALDDAPPPPPDETPR